MEKQPCKVPSVEGQHYCPLDPTQMFTETTVCIDIVRFVFLVTMMWIVPHVPCRFLNFLEATAELWEKLWLIEGPGQRVPKNALPKHEMQSCKVLALSCSQSLVHAFWSCEFFLPVSGAPFSEQKRGIDAVSLMTKSNGMPTRSHKNNCKGPERVR